MFKLVQNLAETTLNMMVKEKPVRASLFCWCLYTCFCM